MKGTVVGRENWDRVDYGGGGACLLFFFIILPIFIWSPLWWLWVFILIPPIGYGSGRYYYDYYVPVKTVKTVTTYNPLEDPREGRDIFEDIEMKELKF
jgi:hypothetical protein